MLVYMVWSDNTAENSDIYFKAILGNVSSSKAKKNLADIQSNCIKKEMLYT